MKSIALLAALVFGVGSAAGQRAPDAPIFILHTSDFWLNLHQFLYVLGRDEARMPDRTRRATAGAPADAARGLASLPANESQAWREAITFYARGPSTRDAVFDESLVEMAQALAGARDASSLAASGVHAEVADVLEKVAPIYRKAWWPDHERANATWMQSTDALVAKHGRAVLDFIMRAYGLSWPAAGYPVHVTAYANWAGAFSAGEKLLLVSSLDPTISGMTALEIVFHESMHQWDSEVHALLDHEGSKRGSSVPDLLSHAMIFYTAGEAVRSVASDHIPYAEANGLWKQRGLGALKPALDEIWRPYLQGKGSREEAIALLVSRVGTKN